MYLEYSLSPSDMLLELIRLESYNGGEDKIIDKVKVFLENNDIFEINIVEDGEGKANLVATIEGGKPIISFVSHSDTVPIGDPNTWTANPFGEIKNNKIYGRGAFDNKGQLVSQLFSFAQLKHLGINGLKLIIFSGEERQDKQTGARWMIRENWHLIKCDYALGEGGITMEVGGKKILLVSFGERGGAEFHVKLTGKGGHSGFAEDGASSLKRTLIKLLATNPLIKNDAGAEAIRYMKKHFPFNGILKKLIFMTPEFRKVIKSLSNVQINISKIHLHGNGRYLNMMPTILELWINMRLVPNLPEKDAEDILKKFLEPIAEKGNSSLSIRKLTYVPSKTSSLDTDFYKYLRANVTKYGFDSVAPILIPASTDLTWFRERGVASYGFFPSLVSTVDMAKSSHRADEFISEEALYSSIESTVNIVKDFKEAFG